MPNVYGIEFNPNQAELVKDLIRELLKDGDCAVYALHNMQPRGELRMATTLPNSTQKENRGVFVRIRPGLREAVILRPTGARGGEEFMPVSRHTQAETLEMIRTWRRQTGSLPHRPRPEPAGPQIVFSVGKKKNHHGR